MKQRCRCNSCKISQKRLREIITARSQCDPIQDVTDWLIARPYLPLQVMSTSRRQIRYGSIGSDWRTASGKRKRKITLLDPERYPLYIGNKIATSSDEYEYTIPHTKSPSNFKAHIVSAVTFVLYVISSAPTMLLLSRHLIGRWSPMTEANLSTSANGSSCVNGSNSWLTNHDAIHKRVTDQVTLYTCVQCIPAVVSTLFLGAYSDTVGRRPVLLIAFTGSVAKLLIIIAVMSFGLNIDFLLAAFGVDGLTGSSFVTSMAVFATASDLHQDYAGRVLWLAFLVALKHGTEALTACLVAEYGAVTSEGATLTICLLLAPLVLAIIATAFLLPETRPMSDDTRLPLCTRLGRLANIYSSDGTRTKRWTLVVGLVIAFLLDLNVGGPSRLDLRYLTDSPFCWGHERALIFSTLRLAGQALIAAIVLKILMAQTWGTANVDKLAVASTLFQAGSFVLEALATSSLLIYFVPVVGLPSLLPVSTVLASMALMVSRHDQGSLFAGLAALGAVATLICTVPLDKVYQWNAQASFFLFAACASCCFGFLILFYYLDRKVSRSELSLEESEKESDQRSQADQITFDA